MIMWGSRGSSKSYAAGEILLDRCTKWKDFRCVCIRKEVSKNADSTFKLLIELIKKNNLTSIFTWTNSPNMRIKCINGNEFLFRGMDNIDNIKSLVNVSNIWFEEEVPDTENDFETVALTARSNTAPFVQFIYTMNPTIQDHQNHWFFKRWFENETQLTFKKELKMVLDDGEIISEWATIHHCFIGSTLITTNNGQKRIDEIKIGDLVLTRQGYKKILSTHKNGLQEVRTYKIGDVIITCTPNHKFYTKEFGFKEISSLSHMKATFSLYDNITDIWKEKLLFIEELPSNYMKEKVISVRGSTENTTDYIDMSMSVKSEQYQKDIILTTLMEINETTILPTYNVSQEPNIWQNTENKCRKNAQTRCINGIEAKKVGKKQAKKQKKDLLISSGNITVKPVVKNLTEVNNNLIGNSAHTTVSQELAKEKVEKLLLDMEYANAEQSLIKLNDIHKKNSVEENVVTNIILKPKDQEITYDLTVEDYHEYFANGILVSNSTYLDNKWLDKGTYNSLQLLKLKDPYTYSTQALGRWSAKTPKGRFWKLFDLAKNSVRKNEYNPDIPIHFSFDFNKNPGMHVGCYQVEGKIVKQIYEISLSSPNNRTKDACEVIKRVFANHTSGIYIYGDPNGYKEDSSTEKGYNNFAIIFDMLSMFRPGDRTIRKAPPVAKSGEWINEIFFTKLDGIDVLIPEDCSESLSDFIYTQEDSDGTVLKPKIKDKEEGTSYEKYGHFSDLFRYFMTVCFASEFHKYKTPGGFNPVFIPRQNKNTW